MSVCAGVRGMAQHTCIYIDEMFTGGMAAAPPVFILKEDVTAEGCLGWDCYGWEIVL